MAKNWRNIGKKRWFFFLEYFLLFLVDVNSDIVKSIKFEKISHTKKYHLCIFLFFWVFYYRVFLGQKSRNAAKSRFRILGLLKKIEKSQKTDDIVGIVWANLWFLKNQWNSDFASDHAEFDFFVKKYNFLVVMFKK